LEVIGATHVTERNPTGRCCVIVDVSQITVTDVIGSTKRLAGAGVEGE